MIDSWADRVRQNPHLFGYQKTLIIDVVSGANKYGIYEKSRRIGGSWTFAIAAIEYCLATDQNCWFSSSDERNGREFILYVKAYAEVYNAVLGCEWIDLKLSTAESVMLPNGSRISALSSNPKALRGKDGLIVLDEVALHEDQENLFRAAQGCVVQRGKPNWSHYRTTLEDAVREGYAKKFAPQQTDTDFIASVKSSCLNSDAYDQEYGCKPLSLKSLLSDVEYDAVALEVVPEELANRDYADLYFGLDVGRTNDQTDLWIVEQLENAKAVNEHERYDYRTVCHKAIRNMDFPGQAALLRPLIAHPSIRRGFIDEGAVGRALADAFCDEFADRCEAYSFTSARKGVLAERLKGFVQAKRVSVPLDKDVKEQFLAMQRSASAAGTLTYDGRTRTSHCDAFWSASLALAAAGEGPGLIIV